MISFRLTGDSTMTDRFFAAATGLAFCPSLGETSTTLSHPASTSHRGLSEQEAAELGITAGTIRLSVGIESVEFITEALEQGLAGAAS